MTVDSVTRSSGPAVSRRTTWLHTGGCTDIETDLRWYREDPLAVKMLFHTVLGPVVWTIGRDELAAVAVKGAETAGMGDAVVSRLESAQTGAGTQLCLELSGPDGVCVLMCPVQVCREFLNATYRYVPDGSEEIDVDAAIGLLLACEDD